MLRLACNITGLDELRYEVVSPRIRQKPPTLRRRLSVRKERKREEVCNLWKRRNPVLVVRYLAGAVASSVPVIGKRGGLDGFILAVSL